ncbi:GDP-mannose 4,6-dehydratase [Thermodesulfobacteriota bacterium]
MRSKKALICGVTGQDGAYLARQLIEKGYEVVGSSRDAQVANLFALEQLQVKSRVEVISVAINDFRSVIQALKNLEPDEVYNLAGQTSVGLSFDQPVEAMESIGGGTLNILEAIRILDQPIKFYNACSSECFGDTGKYPADETTPFRPQSPYAVAKASAFWLVDNYRKAYGIFACSGILFNHESPLRPLRFVTRKVVRSACLIARGSAENLKIGNLDVSRDWGWAPEYVVAMWKMLQQLEAEDFVVATGNSSTLNDFVDAVFSELGLNWREHVEIDSSLMRPVDIAYSCGNATKASEKLCWKAEYTMKDIARAMVEQEMRHLDMEGVA